MFSLRLGILLTHLASVIYATTETSLTEWSSWGPCSTTCERSRTRFCSADEDCQGQVTDTQWCENPHLCRAPDFISNYNTYTEVVEKSRLYLYCPVVGTPKLYIKWFKDGKRLWRSKALAMVGRSLWISSATADDSGMYKCVVHNKLGDASRIVRVKVLEVTWSNWSPCSLTCGGGQMTRTRTCPQSADSDKCPGPDTESIECNAEDCPPGTTSWTTKVHTHSIKFHHEPEVFITIYGRNDHTEELRLNQHRRNFLTNYVAWFWNIQARDVGVPTKIKVVMRTSHINYKFFWKANKIEMKQAGSDTWYVFIINKKFGVRWGMTSISFLSDTY